MEHTGVFCYDLVEEMGDSDGKPPTLGERSLPCDHVRAKCLHPDSN